QQFFNQQVWKLVPLPDEKIAIGTKWILKNKRDAKGIVVRNKARLVAQGHRQEEGIDYDEPNKYVKDMLKKFDMESVRTATTPYEVLKLKSKDEPDDAVNLEAYSDSDYVGSHGDRKSTTGGCQFLSRRLISWQCKKQTIVATSFTEAEYVNAASCCSQASNAAGSIGVPAGGTSSC
nr:ribonuclease H-like domain, reverse transcriptase, RNA-dependent DNA polymerase [Tanacetum cinerariifolium]